jgi:hypothetical protein
MLPKRALALIREYSKPLTRTDWRNGSLTASLILKSTIMIYINKTIKHQLTIESDNPYSCEQFKRKFNHIFEYTGNYIQKYGEALLIYTHPYLDNPPYANFYFYAKYYLKDTKHLVLYCRNYYEYKYLKN